MNEIYLQNGKKIWFEKLSSRRFRINTNHSHVKIIRDDKGEFIKLDFSGMFSFDKGEKVCIVDGSSGEYVNYILNDVEEFSAKEFHGIEKKVNASSIFVLPLLGFSHLDFEYNNFMYICYISEDYKTLYIEYKFNNSKKYLSLEERLHAHPEFLGFMDYDSEFVVFKFNLPEKHLSSIDKILNGKYSQIPDEIKTRILDFHGLNINSRLGGTLYKTKGYKKQLELELGVYISDDIDLMSKPRKDRELWNYQDISQKIGIEF